MKFTHIPFHKTGFFSKTMTDYLDQKKSIKQFYSNFPDIKGFASQINEKKKSFDLATREKLVTVLKDQYRNVSATEAIIENINSLENKETFTITTGHQLNLFTGPLYFLYKIISTINLTESLAEQFPDQRFVPVYWMATEDHDFKEISYFNFKGKEVSWDRPNGGAVGRFSLEGLQEVHAHFSKQLGDTKNAIFLSQLFEKAYVSHSNLADATRYIANELFKSYGLVILDADDQRLKNIFAPLMKDELLYQTSKKAVSKTILNLEKKYKIQVNPRDINLFYLTENSRERIIENEGKYTIHNTDLVFSEAEILNELENHSDRFSPNVILRGAYQETILPSVVFVGGGGELAYWMELKNVFAQAGVNYPVLLLRNSFLFINEKQAKQWASLEFNSDALFNSIQALELAFVKQQSVENLALTEHIASLTDLYKLIQKDVIKIDSSLGDHALNLSVQAQKKLALLEKKMIRAEKRKQHTSLARIHSIKSELFPDNNLQERVENFSKWVGEYGWSWVEAILKNSNSVDASFTIIHTSKD